MEVKCAICKNKKDKKNMYSPTGKSPWYCSEEEYEMMMRDVETRDNIYDILKELLNTDFVSPAMRGKVKELHKYYSHDVIKKTIESQRETLEYWLENKDFDTEYGKANYLFAIVGNNIQDVYKKMELEKKQKRDMLKTISNIELDDFELVNQNVGKKTNDISMFL